MIYKVTLNGKTYEVEVESGEAMLKAEYDAVAPVPSVAAQPAPAAPVAAAPAAAAPAPAAPAAPTAAGETVASPMPGSIIDVRVTTGQAVKSGDILVILEAMKMENEILAPRDGTVAQVLVTKGTSVDTGAALVVLG